MSHLALSFPKTIELFHFERTSLRAAKKIFATLDIQDHLACVKFSEIDQNVLSSFDASIIYPVSNKWDKKGTTYINLKKLRKDMPVDPLATA